VCGKPTYEEKLFFHYLSTYSNCFQSSSPFYEYTPICGGVEKRAGSRDCQNEITNITLVRKKLAGLPAIPTTMMITGFLLNVGPTCPDEDASTFKLFIESANSSLSSAVPFTSKSNIEKSISQTILQ
jgi:hypothetical protein